MARTPTIAIGLAAALALTTPSCATNEPGAMLLDQGWSDELRELYYFTPQGSQMVPLGWFLALETADGSGRFANTANLARYGLIAPARDWTANTADLPIGFAVEHGTEAPDGGPWLGLTCAACHTAQVTVEGQPIRIDGGPAHFDFDSFYAALAQAVTLTLQDPERFERFAAALSEGEATTDRDALKLALTEFQVRIAGDAALRRPALASGFGRVDALTQIVNSIAMRDQREPANMVPPAAPTSYPQLWLAPRLEFVQWNPIASSPIGRNGGQVLGVFGTTALTGPQADWYGSSLRLGELAALEGWIADLQPPRWDEAVMGAIDRDRAAAGEALFAEHCAACHNMQPYRLTDPATNAFGQSFIAIGRVDYRRVGTDPAYVEALTGRSVRTTEATAPLVDGRTVVPAAEFFLASVAAVVGRSMAEAELSDQEALSLNGFRFKRTETGELEGYQAQSIFDLKASPLAAVWATGPYLHNGSVATVYELLSPEAERRAVFWTGGRELDRERLGFVSDDAPGRFRFDTALKGNRNTGHLYPASGLDHEQRLAVIEYLKTQ